MELIPKSAAALHLPIIRAFVGLQFSGGLGMLLLLSSAYFSRTQFIRRINSAEFKGTKGTPNDSSIYRSQTWYSFCISWIISCFSYCLLFFAGMQFNVDEEPAHGICLVQSALIYSSPPLTGFTTFSLFFDLWMMYRTAVTDRRAGMKTVMRSLLLAPYALWVPLTVGLLIVGGVHPQWVERDLIKNAPFCVMNHPAVPIFVCILTLICSLGVLVMLVILSAIMYRTRVQVNVRNSSRTQKQLLALIVRLMVFGILALVAVAISTVYVFNQTPGFGINLVLATLPPAGVLVFGTQKDFLQLWVNLLRWSFRSLLSRSSSKENQTQLSGKKNHFDHKKEGHTHSVSQLDNEIIEMDIVPEFGNSNDVFLILPQDEEQVLVSPRRMQTVI